jgi:hypothetical protein
MVLLGALACGRPEPRRDRDHAPELAGSRIPDARPEAITAPPTRPSDAAVEPDATPDAAVEPPATLDAALDQLRTRGFGEAAAAIERRIAQRSPKLKLSPEAGLAAAIAVLAVAELPAFRALHDVMPRSTVELARAVAERGVPRAEAERIAEYLVGFCAALDFERLAVFDENHSHVTGREWHEIDYTGEGTTWQRQQAYWEPRGVISFERREYIHAYFVGAEPLPHWKKVYRPRGRVADVKRAGVE